MGEEARDLSPAHQGREARLPSAREACLRATWARELSLALVLTVAGWGSATVPVPQAKGQRCPVLFWVGPAHGLSSGHRWVRCWVHRPMLGAPPAGGHQRCHLWPPSQSLPPAPPVPSRCLAQSLATHKSSGLIHMRVPHLGILVLIS